MQCLTIYLTEYSTYTSVYDLYSNVDGYTTPFETDVAQQDLIDGYFTELVPDGATTVRVTAKGSCSVYIDIIFASATPTPTPTISTTPTVTPSITITPSITPTISTTPTASITPSVTPSITTTPTPSPTPEPVLLILQLDQSGAQGVDNLSMYVFWDGGDFSASGGGDSEYFYTLDGLKSITYNSNCSFTIGEYNAEWSTIMTINDNPVDSDNGEYGVVTAPDQVDVADEYGPHTINPGDVVLIATSFLFVAVTPTPTPTNSVTPTITPSVTPSISITPTTTPSVTPSITPSVTPSVTESPGISPSPTPTTTPSITPTISVTPTVTPSATSSVTPSVTPTISESPGTTPTATPSISVSPSVTPSITASPSITPSVTPSTSMVIYAMCSGSSPSFQSYEEDLIGLLTVSGVTLSSGTLGDFLIDWNLNSITGETVFKTGNSGNTDPTIQAYHPFDSELVQGGELYPVIRYMEIDSTFYTPYQGMSGYSYSPDLESCLPSITVDTMSCAESDTGSTYGYTVTYTNASMPSWVAGRELRYDITEATEHVMWEFTGYLIADRLTIKYVSGTGQTTIDDWVIGSDNASTDYDVTPKLYDTSGAVKSVFTLTGFSYTEGDYVLFVVDPSYNSPGETDTNWQFRIQCATTDNPFDWYFAPNEVNDVITGTTMYLAYSADTCTYDFHFKTVSGATISSANQDIEKYFNISNYTSTDWSVDQSFPIAAYTGGTIHYSTGGSGADYVLNGTKYINITGSTHRLEVIFTDATDYYSEKSLYTGRTDDPTWTDWSSDPHDPEHYKMWLYQNRISLSSGDTGTNINMNIAPDADFSFDDGNLTIGVDLKTQYNEYTGVTCDLTGDVITPYFVGTTNTWYSGYTESYETVWGRTVGFYYRYLTRDDKTETSETRIVYTSLQTGLTQTCGYDFPSDWYYNSIAKSWQFYKCYLRVDITNTSDPENNFEVYNRLNEDGSVGDWVLIYKVGT